MGAGVYHGVASSVLPSGSTTLPNKATVIRHASASDTEALIALGLAFVRDSPYTAHVAENPEQIGKVIAFLLAQPNSTILVAERDGAVIGLIGLAMVPHLWSGVLTVSELAYYVHPDHRGTVGIRLLKAAEAWAGASGAKAMQMIAPSAEVGRFYERLHYRPLETNYEKRI